MEYRSGAGRRANSSESIGIEGMALENALLYEAAQVAAVDRDPVTSLYNHRAIHQRLRVEFQRAVSPG